MRAILVRVVVFSIGAFAFWLAYFLEQLRLFAAHGHTPHGTPVLDAFRNAGALALFSGLGVFLGLAAARRATPRLPVWLTIPAGLLLGFLTRPSSLESLGKVDIPVPRTVLGYLLTVAIAAAIFAWLCVQSVQLLRRHFPAIRNEYHRVKSSKLEMASLVLAVAPWLFGTLQFLGTPGFG